MNILELIRDILSTPAILLGTITLLGLLFQKKPRDYIIKGTITTIVGYTLLSSGSTLLQNGALKDFGVLFNFDFHIQGVIPNMEAISSLGISQYGILVSEVMVLGMIANLVLARFSSFRYIFLTGHHTLYMACLLVVVFSQTGMKDWQVILSGSMILGLLMSILPALIQKDMNLVTKNNKLAYGHFSVIGCLLAGKIARLVRKRNRYVQLKS